MGPKQVLAIQVRVDLRVMVMKGFFTQFSVPELEPNCQMKFCVMSRTFFMERKGLPICRRYCQHILSPYDRAYYWKSIYLWSIHKEIFFKKSFPPAMGKGLETKWHMIIWCQSLSDKIFLQVSRTLLSILAYFNSGMIWMVSILPLISNSSSLFSKLFSKSTNYN